MSPQIDAPRVVDDAVVLVASVVADDVGAVVEPAVSGEDVESTPLLTSVDSPLTPNVSSEQPRVATSMLVAIAPDFSMTPCSHPQ